MEEWSLVGKSGNSHIAKFSEKQINFDGKPCAMKVARTVWGGGKDRDCIKFLPIVIVYACINDSTGYVG